MQESTIEGTQTRIRKELETILGRTLDVGDEQRLLHELGVDSMSLVELLVAIERAFGVRIVETGVKSEDLRTIQGLASAIHRGREE